MPSIADNAEGHACSGARASAEHIKERYGVERKELHALKERAAKMAGAMAAFCERMGYRDLEVLITRFQVI